MKAGNIFTLLERLYHPKGSLRVPIKHIYILDQHYILNLFILSSPLCLHVVNVLLAAKINMSVSNLRRPFEILSAI